MKLDDDFDFEYDINRTNKKAFKQSPIYTYTMICVVLVMITILAIVILANDSTSRNGSTSANA